MPVDLKKTWDACGEAFHRYTTAANSFSELIERPAIDSIIGDLDGLRVLDLACGSGVYTIRFAEEGATVSAIDISETMIELGRKEAATKKVTVDFIVGDISHPLNYQDSGFDLVFSSTALHYVPDLDPVFKEVSRVLNARGRFVASVLHPVSTSRFPVAASEHVAAPASWDSRSTWHLHYHDVRDREVETPWLGFGDVQSEGKRLRCHHHRLVDYAGALWSAGLQLTALIEPGPPRWLADENPAMFEETISVPVYLVFAASKVS
jgi:SAM-dependent methyltransferase